MPSILPWLLPFAAAIPGPAVAGCLAFVFCRKSLRRQSQPPWSLSPLFALLGIVSTWLALRFISSASLQPPTSLSWAEGLSVVTSCLVAFYAVAHYRRCFTPDVAAVVPETPVPTELACPVSAESAAPKCALSPATAANTVTMRIVEFLLVLFALDQCRVLHLYYWLLKGARLAYDHPSDASWMPWLHYLLHQFIGLGILGYILFRNSRWSQAARTPSDCTSTGTLPEASLSPTGSRVGQTVAIFELLLILLTAFGCSIIGSLRALPAGMPVPEDPDWTVSWLSHAYGMMHEAGALVLLGYVLYRNAQCFRDLGLRWTSRDAARALPLFIAGLVIYRFYKPLVVVASEAVAGHALEQPNVSKLLFGNEVAFAAVLSDILVGFFEELIVRAYLISAILRLTNSRVFAIVVSVGVQVSYHFYQGVPLGLSHIALFLLFSLYYVNTRRILPVALAHSLVDLSSLWHYTLYAASNQ